MDKLSPWDMHRREQTKQQGANCYWDDILFSENPFRGDISCINPVEGYELEFQAWADGWNQADREIFHGAKTDEPEKMDQTEMGNR